MIYIWLSVFLILVFFEIFLVNGIFGFFSKENYLNCFLIIIKKIRYEKIVIFFVDIIILCCVIVFCLKYGGIIFL